MEQADTRDHYERHSGDLEILPIIKHSWTGSIYNDLDKKDIKTGPRPPLPSNVDDFPRAADKVDFEPNGEYNISQTSSSEPPRSVAFPILPLYSELFGTLIGKILRDKAALESALSLRAFVAEFESDHSTEDLVEILLLNLPNYIRLILEDLSQGKESCKDFIVHERPDLNPQFEAPASMPTFIPDVAVADLAPPALTGRPFDVNIISNANDLNVFENHWDQKRDMSQDLKKVECETIHCWQTPCSEPHSVIGNRGDFSDDPRRESVAHEDALPQDHASTVISHLSPTTALQARGESKTPCRPSICITTAYDAREIFENHWDLTLDPSESESVELDAPENWRCTLGSSDSDVALEEGKNGVSDDRIVNESSPTEERVQVSQPLAKSEVRVKLRQFAQIKSLRNFMLLWDIQAIWLLFFGIMACMLSLYTYHAIMEVEKTLFLLDQRKKFQDTVEGAGILLLFKWYWWII